MLVKGIEVRAGKQASHTTGSGIRSQARLTPERGFEPHRFTATCIFSVTVPAAQREPRLAEAVDLGPWAGRPPGRCFVDLQLQRGATLQGLHLALSQLYFSTTGEGN